MSDMDDLKDRISKSQASLESKVKDLESNVKETAATIKGTVENGVAGVLKVANAVSPTHHINEHPLLFVGAMFSVGFLLGGKSRASDRSLRSDSKQPYASPPVSKQEGIAAPIAYGIFAALAGEVVKKYVPQARDQASSIQSAIVGEMAQRVVKGLKS